MGYRSEVALCLSTKGKQALDAALHEADTAHEYYKDITDFVNHAECAVMKNQRMWPTCGQTSSGTPILKRLNFTDDTEYLFTRIGESDDALECLGSHWENGLDMTFTLGVG